MLNGAILNEDLLYTHTICVMDKDLPTIIYDYIHNTAQKCVDILFILEIRIRKT